MKKTLFALAIVLASFTLYMCTTDGFLDIDTTSKIEPIFLKNDSQWGHLFEENLIYITKKIKQEKISFQNQSQLHGFAQKSSLEFFNKNGLKKSNKPYINSDRESFTKYSVGEIFKKNLNTLTENQKKVLRQIAKARENSKSYLEFSNQLATINNSIYSSIPKNEQKRLFFVTSTLYFGLKAMNEMAKEGIISGKPEYDGSGLTLAQLCLGLNLAHAQSEVGGVGNSESWWNSCNDSSSSSSTLGTIWVVALAEPSPFGEIIATGATIVIGAYLLYEFVGTCIDVYEATSTNPDLDHCIRLYELCTTSTTNNNCSTCLQFCNTQGYWDFDNCPL